ncbi:hypothetical protein B296_00026924 [Ensete ventricosum]|uniref:Uncharacterized protein n=1 Tax=Ensete ventricosum TaxID=4639 RepID=A0A426ZEP0_ENSVE|nr:hypothetical protein B296_00026924 [Ensete ventricosum]
MRCLEIRPDSIARNRNGVEPAIMNGQDTFFDDGAFDPTIVVDLETLGGPFLWPFLTIRIPSNLGAHETALYSNVDRKPWWAQRSPLDRNCNLSYESWRGSHLRKQPSAHCSRFKETSQLLFLFSKTPSSSSEYIMPGGGGRRVAGPAKALFFFAEESERYEDPVPLWTMYHFFSSFFVLF